MKRYCRYCAWCSEIDSGYYCSEKDECLTESQVKHETKCGEYGYCAIDVITGKDHVITERVTHCIADEFIINLASIVNANEKRTVSKNEKNTF